VTISYADGLKPVLTDSKKAARGSLVQNRLRREPVYNDVVSDPSHPGFMWIAPTGHGPVGTGLREIPSETRNLIALFPEWEVGMSHSLRRIQWVHQAQL